MIPIIDYVNEKKEELKNKISSSKIKYKLTIVQVGNNSASNSYIKGKKKDCEFLNIDCEIVKFPENITEDKLIGYLKTFNSNNIKNLETKHNIIVQMPLPKHINEDKIKRVISPILDVDGFHPLSKHSPCTPKGIIEYLKNNNINLKGKNITIIGRSNIVGKPLANMLLKEDATITLCHSKTVNLKNHTKQADIIISAIGKPKFITKEYIGNNKPIIIDVGINRDENNNICGDVDFDDVIDKCSFITPVPKGVGLLTRLALSENIIE